MDVVTRQETPVLFVRAEDGPGSAPAAFARLEAALGGPRGRRFLGWFRDGEYRACVVRTDDDDPRALRLDADVLPGGQYARRRHEGPAHTIHESFGRLLKEHRADRSRPSLEDYRRHDEVWALLPIVDGAAVPPSSAAVELRTITTANFADVVKLTVSEDQRSFVAQNVYSLAQTTIYPWARPRAVHVDGTPVGFVLYGKDPADGEWCIVRLMVDAAHQRKGYGREAVRLTLAEIAREEPGRDVILSIVPSNAAARAFYEALGFEPTGRVVDGEDVLRRPSS